MFLSKHFLVCLILSVALFINVVLTACDKDCSHRGLCINDKCVCAEGLSGSGCSDNVQSSLPTLYECPTCYQVTVGSARYISGPSWRLPDGPIIGLNYKGNVSVYQGNGNGEMISSGTSLDDWLPSPLMSLKAGTAGNFDSCGSWLMRALTGDSGKVLGFYHAETACVYANNGQTRKSGGFAESSDGGKSFAKPNYPNNKITDTSSPITIGAPSGEGDMSVVARGNYYYMFIGNVETWHTAVARASKSGNGYPGTWFKYFNGQYTEKAVGGQSSRVNNVAGTQVYLHTPSQSFVSVGNANPYWNYGFMMSVSDNAIDWNYFADPIFTPDPVTNLDDVLYPSFLGPTGGYDIGSKFKFYYMWIPPWTDWSNRYQIAKDISLTYVGPNNTMPLTKIALTSYRASDSQETWQTTELCVDPYHPVGIVGYLMSRPYPYTFVVYDCYNHTSKDHFVGTADECFLSGSGVEVTRTLGHIWSTRVAKSIAIYRCFAGKDTFLSSNTNCDGLAPSETVPFGYVMDGPAFALAQDILIPQGASWKFNSKLPSGAWTQLSYDDSAWPISASPFGQSYSTAKSFFGGASYYFRYNFQVAPGKVVKNLLLSVSSDDYAIVYLNGVQVDSDSVTWHEASYWNRRVFIDSSSLIIGGDNVLAVKTQNADNWAYFDLMLVVNYDTSSSSNSKRSVEAESKILVQKQETAQVTREIPQYDRSIDVRAEDDTFKPLLVQGSNWKYVNSGVPADSWIQMSFDDSAWATSAAPFVTGYSAYTNKGTPFRNNDYYFRSKFTIPAGQIVTGIQLNVASDNYAIVYINGYQVDRDPSLWHTAQYWNRQVSVATSIINTGDNIVAVVTKNMDQWAFFDLQIDVQYASSSAPPAILIPQGSVWLYYNKGAPTSTWSDQKFDDSTWESASAPFVTGYSAFTGTGKTPFGPTNYYFRSKFTIPAGTSVTSMTVSVASDNSAIVFVNGIQVDADPASWHTATYWNRQVVVDSKYLLAGSNTIAVLVMNQDKWAFFDLQLSATYGNGPVVPTTKPVTVTPAPTAAPSTPTVLPTAAPAPGVRAVLIPKSSSWSYVKTKPSSLWNLLSFDDSSWVVSTAPFVSGYSAYTDVGTPFGNVNHYFRSKFTVPVGQTVQSLSFSIASDNYAVVYVNGQLVDSDETTWHEAKYWNRQVTVDTSFITTGLNLISVVVMNQDQWAFFDLQLDVVYVNTQVPSKAPTAAPTAAPANGMLVAKASSWKYYNNQTAPAGTWVNRDFNDASWKVSQAPFVTGYTAYNGIGTPFSNTNHYFRSKFTIASARDVASVMLSVASDNYAIVYINGQVVDRDPSTWHQAAYWNRELLINTSAIVSGENTIAVVTMNMDQWAFFDLQLVANFSAGGGGGGGTVPPPVVVVDCGIKGQVIGGVCTCDAGWGSANCTTNLCAYTGTQKETVIAAGSSWRNIQWATTQTTPLGWFGQTFDDSWWQIQSAPFGTSGYTGVTTKVSGARRLYRKKFLINVPFGMITQNATLSIMSEDVHRIWINGKFIDTPIYPYVPHTAKRWNSVINVEGSLFGDVNVIAVEVPLVDGRWTTYFDMQLVTSYSIRTCTTLIV